MKKVVLFLFLFFVSVSLCAQTSSIERMNKKWMVEDINKGNYARAYDEFQKIALSFDADESDTALELEKLVAFVDYATKRGVPDEQRRRLSAYLGRCRFVFVGGGAFFDNDYATSIREFRLAIPYLKEGNDTAGYASCLSYLWESEYNIGDTVSANATMRLLSEIPLRYHTFRSVDNCGVANYGMRNYEKALFFYAEELRLIKNQMPLNEDNYGSVLLSMAGCHKCLKDTVVSDSLYISVYSMWGNEYSGQFLLMYMSSVSDIADALDRRGNTAQSLAFRQQGASYALRNPSKNNVFLLLSLAQYYDHSMQDEKSAEKVYADTRDLLRSIGDTLSSSYFLAVDGLAGIHKHWNRTDLAEKEYEEAVRVAAIVKGTESRSYMLEVCLLAFVYQSNRKMEQCISVLLPIVDVLKRTGDEVFLADVYNQIAVAYSHNADFVNSYEYHKKALPLYEKVKGRGSRLHLEELKACVVRVRVLPEERKEILSFINLGLRLADSLYTKRSLQYIDFLSLYGNYLRYGDEVDKAKKVYESILSYCGDLSSSDSIVMEVNKSLGFLSLDEGDFVNAEKYYLKAIEYAKSAKIRPATYATILSNLGLLYSDNNMFEQADKMFMEAYDIHQVDMDTVTGVGHWASYGSLLKNIAELKFNEILYGVSSDERMALYFANLALEEFARQSGINSLDYAVGLHTKADIMSLYDVEKAEAFYLQALQIRKDVAGECSSECAQTYNALGTLGGNLDKSRLYYEKAIEIYTKLGINPGGTFFNLASVNYRQGNYDSSSSNLARYIENVQREVESTFGALSELQSQQYWSKYGFLTDYTMSIVRKAESVDVRAASVGYDVALLGKGILLNAMQQRQKSILNSGDSVLIAMWNELASYRRQVIRMQESGDEDEAVLRYLETKSQELDKQISMYKFVPKETITWRDIQAELKEGELAVEFVKYNNYNSQLVKDSVLYAAMIVRRGMDAPVWVNLFEESELSSLLTPSPAAIYESTELYRLIWSKLQPFMRNGDTVYFSPDGLMYQVNIELAEDGDGSCVNEKYNLVRVSSTREVLNHSDKKKEKSAVLYGGLIYDRSVEDMAEESSKYMRRSLDFSLDTAARVGASYLPGTKREILRIAEVLSKDDYKVVLDSAEVGTEESFKALGGETCGILHVATHGFFFKQEEAERRDLYAQRLRLDRIRKVADDIDPMLRCGLLLSGANRAFTGHRSDLPEGVQDGILMAKEIALLDLNGVALVTLSACQTGEGEINSDGVFGLQRAFKMAGVQTIIMSLWKVNDTATQMLMTEFYRNWIEKGQSKRAAFRNAQNAVRDYVDNDGERMFESPEYWAGFIMLD